MPYLLDGLNVIHKIEKLYDELEAKGPEAAVRLLVNELLRLWPDVKGRVEIVVDKGGGQYGRRLPVRGILVRYSANDESADELITRLVDKSTAYYVLVSDDKGLAASLGRKLTGVISVKDFFRCVVEKGKFEEKFDEKPSSERENDTEFWMKIFGAQ